MRGGDKPSIFQNRATRACGSRVALKEIATIVMRGRGEKGLTLPDGPEPSRLPNFEIDVVIDKAVFQLCRDSSDTAREVQFKVGIGTREDVSKENENSIIWGSSCD